MRRRGFTLIELMLASSISVIVMTSILGLLYAVWTLAKNATDELQGALSARAMRDRLVYHLTDDFGLINATNITMSAGGLTVKSRDGVFSTAPSDKSNAAISDIVDWSPQGLDSTRKFRDSADHVQVIYLKKTNNKATYYDRLVLPMCQTNGIDEIRRAFGNGK